MRISPLCENRLPSKAIVLNAGILVPCSLDRLDALDPNAYEAFKASRNLQDVVERVLRNEQEVEKQPGQRRALSVQASLMTPVQPMLVRSVALPCYPHCTSLGVGADRDECRDCLQGGWRIGRSKSGEAAECCSLEK